MRKTAVDRGNTLRKSKTRLRNSLSLSTVGELTLSYTRTLNVSTIAIGSTLLTTRETT